MRFLAKYRGQEFEVPFTWRQDGPGMKLRAASFICRALKLKSIDYREIIVLHIL